MAVNHLATHAPANTLSVHRPDPAMVFYCHSERYTLPTLQTEIENSSPEFQGAWGTGSSGRRPPGQGGQGSDHEVGFELIHRGVRRQLRARPLGALFPSTTRPWVPVSPGLPGGSRFRVSLVPRTLSPPRSPTGSGAEGSSVVKKERASDTARPLGPEQHHGCGDISGTGARHAVLEGENLGQG